MRISDWSSDVCSSDLCRLQASAASRWPARRSISAPSSWWRCTPPCCTCCSSEERRVGKSVSVRVDLGGRRIIKKKTPNHTTTQNTKKKHTAKAHNNHVKLLSTNYNHIAHKNT